MQMSKTLRSAVSLCVSLAMLVGMLAVFGAFPVAAAKSVEKFTANFSALPTGTVSMTDTATVKYLEDRFAFFYFQQGWWFQRSDVNGYTMNANGEYLTGSTDGISYMPDVVGQKAGASNSEYVDGTGKNLAGRGISRWLVSGKYLAATAYAKNETAFYKVNSMWVKGDDGDLAVLDNFNLEMDFKPADTTLYNGITTNMDSVAVWFRAKSAGQAYGAADHQVVNIAPDGGLYVGKLTSGISNCAYEETMQYNDAAVTLSRSKEYHMSLTVIGTEMTLIVTDNATDKVVYLLTRAVEDMEAGYLGIGGSTAGAYYGNIEITRLDKDGNAVDFNDHNDGYGFGADFARITDYRQKLPVNTANSWSYNDKGTYFRDNGANIKWLEPVTYNDNTYDFSKPDTYAADKAVVDYLSSKFDFVYNRETELKTFATPYENSNTQDPDSQYGSGANAQWKLQDGRYLNAVFNKQGGETFRKTVSLVPKNTDGEHVVAKNVETEFDMVLGTTAKTGLAFSFRAGVGGQFTIGYKTTTADRITVVFTSGGYKVYEGVIPKDETVTPAVNAWANGATVTKAHVYIKAVDNILTMKVTGMDGTVYYAGSTELTYTAEGTMFYSVLNGTGGFANIRTNRLNADGTVAEWDAPESLAPSINVSTRPTYVITKGDGIAEQLDAMFNAYYDNDGTLTKTGGFPSTATEGAYWKNIYERVNIECSTSASNKTSALKAVGTLVPKTADGKEAVLKNFELSFTTRWAEMTFNNASVGGVVIGFRQQTAGKITNGAGQVNKNQGLIVITSKGVSIAGGNEITDAMYGTANEQTFASELNPKASSNLSYHNVTVRVVGNQVTVKIGDKTYTDTVNYDEAGYLAFGAGAFRMHFSNIKFTRLDDAGNAIDWNADQYESIPTKVTFNGSSLLGGTTSNKYVNGKDNIEYTDTALTVAQRAEYIDAMDSAFDVYYNDYDGANAVYLHNASVVGNNAGYNYGKLQWYNSHAWMRPSAAASGYGSLTGSALRQVGSLVPKDADGEQLKLKNFDLTTAYAFWTGSTGNGAVVVGFRQAEPGRYFDANGKAATGDYLMITHDKLLVYEDGVVKHEKAFSVVNQGQVRILNVKVVGKQLTYKVYWSSTTVLSGTVELSSEKEGYLAFSNTHYLRGFSSSNFSVTALDDLGQEAPIKKPASTHSNGNVAVSTTVENGVYTNTITVTPEEGYELLAGSLIATDAAGDVYVPMRVGFRNGGDASQYVVKCASPVKVSATFYQPTVADPNVGNIGTSINEELAGLRFVSRLARTVKDGTEYVTLDGETFAVSDYGMLVAIKSVLGTDTLTLDLTETNTYVKKLSVKNSGIYYDLCDDYVDMSVCITGIDKVVGGTEMDVVARPYAIAKDKNGDDVKLYAKSFSSNYAENAGLTTVTFSEMEKEGVVKVLGRAGVVGQELQMDWVNTGFEIKGTLTGSVKANMSSTRTDSLLNVSVDGKKPTIVHVPNGSSTVTLANNLSKGEHTIRVESGTSVRWGNLSATALQYLGELETNAKEASKLRMTVFGDSISCGWGMGVLSGGSYTHQELVAASNAYNSYAAITARNLDAYLDNVALCSQTIREIHKYASLLNRRSGAPAWNWEEQDIIIVNLGTNDEWRDGFTPATALTDATALLEDVRAINPDAYIIYVYSMMTDYTQKYQDYLVSYKAAVQSLVNKGDDKIFMLQMTPNRVGYEGHPDTAAHASYATVLTNFIKEKCPDLFGHTTHTETMSGLGTKALFTDRTAASGTARTMTYSNTGLTIEGYLYGELKMNVNVEKDVCALNVIVDGDVENATTVWVEAGDKEVTLLSDLRRGHHTVEIVKGTAHHAGALTMKDITYTGTLTTPTAKDLQIMFIGDSVTVGEGIYGSASPLAKSYNAIDGYASQTARYLGAGVTTVARCGAKIPGMTTQFNAAQDGDKDIVVINMGTNDFGWSSLSGLDIKNDYYPSGTTDIKIKDAITDLIDDVRAKQPDAYIIWTYGMMFDLHLDALKDIVNEYATLTNDAKLLFCDLSAAKDTSGNASHPSTVGNNNAALALTGFIRENCADVLSSVATPEKTFATDRKLKVACVGDSITALKYWDNNMRGELSADKYEVSGFGVSGSTAGFKGVDYVNETTNAGKAYVDQSAYKDALAYNADIVVVMLGTNDSKIVNWPVYADEFVNDYVEIVRSFQNQKNAPMVFIGLPPTVYSTGKFQDISNFRIENFVIPALYEVAAQTGAVIVDTHTPTGGDSTLMSDGVHPGDAGKQILCETFAAAITAKVEG